MTRYQVLREMKVDPFSAGVISFFNWLFKIPENEIRLLNLIIKFDPNKEV